MPARHKQYTAYDELSFYPKNAAFFNYLLLFFNCLALFMVICRRRQFLRHPKEHRFQPFLLKVIQFINLGKHLFFEGKSSPILPRHDEKDKIKKEEVECCISDCPPILSKKMEYKCIISVSLGA